MPRGLSSFRPRAAWAPPSLVISEQQREQQRELLDKTKKQQDELKTNKSIAET